MFQVSLSMPDLDAADPREAAQLFLSALVSADWSNGLVMKATDADGTTRYVTLTAEEVTAALKWEPAQ